MRYLVDIPADAEEFAKDGIASVKREIAYRKQQGLEGPLPTAHLAALSGGGDSGAFGAGLMVGWTESGTRPEFKGVTGVSTGALMAPFVFLGPEYDDKLKSIYTTISPPNVFTPRPIYAALTNDALADNAPLLALVKKYADQEMLKAIAQAHERGRMLLIGTTDLDAERPVIWNITKIAASGHPDALNLIHRILVASAAIPGAFPPVMFEVEAGGKRYEEMHVDGGASAQVFVYPGAVNIAELSLQQHIERERKLYVIRNAQLAPGWDHVDRLMLPIAGRAISAMIRSQGFGDLQRIYYLAQRDGIDYNLAYIGTGFDAPHPEEFDPDYMKKLFKFGYDLGKKGYPWKKTPPRPDDLARE